jgi:hypothetical protein
MVAKRPLRVTSVALCDRWLSIDFRYARFATEVMRRCKMTRWANTGLHLLTGRSMIAPVDDAESRLAGRERHVVGDDRLGETLQGKRANMFSRYASFERHVDALWSAPLWPDRRASDD